MESSYRLFYLSAVSMYRKMAGTLIKSLTVIIKQIKNRKIKTDVGCY